MIPSTDGHEEEMERPEIVAWRNDYLWAINQARSEGKKIVSKWKLLCYVGKRLKVSINFYIAVDNIQVCKLSAQIYKNLDACLQSRKTKTISKTLKT